MRTATIRRETAETQIALTLDLDGSGLSSIATGVGFLDHMLTLLARHALIDLEIEAKGDLEVDDHHTVEDVGIALGQAFRQALGDKRGIVRYADCLLPMDETLTRVALDISGRPFLVFRTEFPSEKIGTFDTELVREWFQAFAINAGVTLHVETLYGVNGHHIAESCFKGLARVLRQAVAIDPATKDRVPSTKGDPVRLMTLYTVHLPPDAVSAEEVAERSLFVKEGFAFFGFAFTGFWMLAQRLWLELIAYLGALALMTALFWQFSLPPGAYAGVTFLLSLLIGLEGNEWIRRRLGRAGWTQAGTVSGPSLDECERRFFKEWVNGGAAPRSAPPPLRPSQAASPVGRPAGVLGIFPEPRGQSGRP